MPGSDTSDLTQTLVSLTRQLLGVPSGSDSLHSVTLGDSDDIDHLVLSENVLDGNSLLHVLTGELDLVSDAAAVQLDLHDVSLLLTTLQHGHLGVDDHADNLHCSKASVA